MTLDFSCRRLDEATVLELRGRLVAANVERLERRLALLLSGLRRPLVIDLAAVTEHDDAGIAVLAGAARAAPPTWCCRPARG
jgi:anti-anti-sigma regulatory factor